jgi:hypothetical protein
MKYKEEYLETLDRKKFVNLVLKKYKNITRQTAERRWYDVVKYVNVPKYDDNVKKEPSFQKMIQFRDMKAYKKILTREYLRQYGFSEIEVNWLEDNGHLDGNPKK